MDVKIDRDGTIPPRQQVRAALIGLIASGELAEGAPLPSVRDLADRAGLAPMTVMRVYAELKAGGLIEARTGAGTFVAVSRLSRLGASGKAAAIWPAMDVLLGEAAAHGIEVADLLSLVTAQAVVAPPVSRVVVVGLFAEATQSYAARIAAQTGLAVEAIALHDEAPTDAALAARLSDAELILTFAVLHPRLAALVPEADIVSLRFIPAEATRLALAALDPRVRLVAVSRFEDFLPILTMGVRRFASHVQDVASAVLGAPGLDGVIARADVVVMSTGAEGAAASARPGAALIEYLHIPDPGDVDRLIGARLGHRTIEARKEAS